jgi:hypothetical protein
MELKPVVTLGDFVIEAQIGQKGTAVHRKVFTQLEPVLPTFYPRKKALGELHELLADVPALVAIKAAITGALALAKQSQ